MRFMPSPHYNERPNDMSIDMIVLHAISLPAGEFDMKYVEQLFLGSLDMAAHPCFHDLQGVQVSAHFVVDRQGDVTQFVACDKRAWHAGSSSWQGRENCNDYAMGIEMIGDELRPFTAKQYKETARLCRALMLRYPDITIERMVGHQDIAPMRKWDPGKQWDWQHFHRSLAHIRNLTSSPT
ncbi:MAG: 1,6-anhydro-N-acetylmuramyl-L-alanine amidase AmpD [Zetaproteobacteria bacterium]|nr:1,6-anhydro-N-acetylmuramyl-L-alanine amidase AmpD [Zetaproteobacteria bacterium]